MTTTAQAGTSTVPAAGPTVLGWFEPGTDAWHAARANGIGGSEIAAVLGLSPYESRFSLWHRKKGLIAPVEETDVMYWGKKHEPTICQEFADRHPGLELRPSPTYASAGHPAEIANPDRLVLDSEWRTVAIVEAKTSRDDEGWGEEGTDQIPVHYRAQCLWYLMVLGVPVCHVAVLIGLSDYREYVVEYDPAEAALMRKAAAEFQASLAADERPSIDGHSATYQAIRELPEGLDAVDVEITTALRDRWHAAQDALWLAEDEATTCKGLLLDAIGTGQRAVCERERVATRQVRDGRTYSLMPARTRRNAR
ncbi:YqaJ viral recombinase family protein [Streptomyces sp. NPDC048200]|uniref:YqaJ viral recombinase family nuclease n=1 Tax=Streptomyces sp. NPDC048200 TaxID=3365512 RepID=UPI0037204C7D